MNDTVDGWRQLTKMNEQPNHPERQIQTGSQDIYDPKFVEALFDTMSGSYTRMNYITSFGFSERWRRQLVEQVAIEPGSVVVDLMTGMGECWKFILRNSRNGKLIGLDFSIEMINRARLNRAKFVTREIEILKEDVFENSIPDQSADVVVSGFGLKTFNEAQLQQLAVQIKRILKPGGRLSLVDVSVPKNIVLRTLYMFYLKNAIPILGFLFLGNPESYRMLGIYTEAFENSKQVLRIFNSEGFEVEYVEYFFGCASGIKGHRKL